jgi:hypothetical protein
VKDSKLEHEDTNEFPITFVERANAENMDWNCMCWNNLIVV